MTPINEYMEVKGTYGFNTQVEIVDSYNMRIKLFPDVRIVLSSDTMEEKVSIMWEDILQHNGEGKGFTLENGETLYGRYNTRYCSITFQNNRLTIDDNNQLKIILY